jgi:phosphomannomutase / phosphoglucomutase
MKKRQTFVASLMDSLLKRTLLVMLVTSVLATLLMYGLWLLVVEPKNQRLFDQQLTQNRESYRENVQQYLSQLRQPFLQLAESIPAEFVYASTDLEQEYEISITTDYERLTQWLVSSPLLHKDRLPELIKMSVLSINQIEQQLQHLPKTTETSEISFLLIDMINRLKKGQPLFIEAAKVVDKAQWELHNITPIKNNNGMLQAVIHSVFSLDGLQRLFTGRDISFGKIVLTQSIDGEKLVGFFAIGQASPQFTPKTSTIAQSHWQISYQPSQALFDQINRVPVWFMIVAIILSLALMAMGFYLLGRLFMLPVSNNINNTIKTKNTPKESESETTIISSEQDTPSTASSTSSVSPSPRLSPETSPIETSAENFRELIPESIFRAYDIRGIAFEQLSHDVVYGIGQAVATEVLAAGDKAIIVGYDARLHSEEFSLCLVEGIISTGCHVISIGLVPTPLMNFSACQHKETSSGIIITASHNPKEYNGCKIVVKGQTLVDSEIQGIKNRIINDDVIYSAVKGKITKEDFSQEYITKVVNDVAIMDGWRVVVDAGNGASSELAPRLFKALQCKTTGLFCQFDGQFPNHDPDPSTIENLAALVAEVKTQKADIGFALDGDGDRLMVVTSTGRILWPDQLLMLFAQDIVARNPGCDVVFDIKSTSLLTQIIADNGGRPIMWKTGHSHIKAKMRETQALLGGEFSGHIFFKERWFGFDDGLYAAARLLELMTLTGQSIDEMLSALPTRVATPEIKIFVNEEEKFALIEKLKQEASFGSKKNPVERTTIDGLRIDYAKGWGLIRASNTAPALTLRFEAMSEGELKKIKKEFERELHKIDKSLVVNF